MRFSGASQLPGNSLGGDSRENGISPGRTKRLDIELGAGFAPVFCRKGGLFFLEGQPATGVFLLHIGRVKKWA